ITGAYTQVLSDSSTYTPSQAGVGPAGNYSLAVNGASRTSVTQVGSDLDDSYTRTATGTDSYRMVETGNNVIGGRLLGFVETVTGTEGYSLKESGVGTVVTARA